MPPDDLKTSGKYTTGRRVDAIGSVMGKSFERPTGVSLPFKASRCRAIPASRRCRRVVLVITDNGMGSR